MNYYHQFPDYRKSAYFRPTVYQKFGNRGGSLKHFEQAPNEEPHVTVFLSARVIGVGVETAAGLTGSPDESGRKRREKVPASG